MLDINKFQSFLVRLPNDVKVMSFDIFDTLLIRAVPSFRVDQIAAKQLSELLAHATKLSISAAHILRSRNHFKSSVKKQNLSGENEWTVMQWLNALAEEISINPALLCRLGKEAELTAESMTLCPAVHGIESIAMTQSRGLYVIATSDMWLDREWLQHLLEHFSLFFDEIFTSGPLGVSKRKGTLFNLIESRLKLPPQAFAHVGDNLKADYIQPRLAGWRSIWMPHPGNFEIKALSRIKRKHEHAKTSSWKEIVRLLEAHPPLKSGADPYFKLGYNYLAPVLVLFSIMQWRRFRQQEIDMVFYIARDAKMMLDVYQLIAHLLPDSCPRTYIRLSRKAVLLVHPDNFLQNGAPVPGKTGRKKIADWLSNFVISPELQQAILSSAGVNLTDHFSDPIWQAIQRACQGLQSEITAEQHIQKQILRDYLCQEAGNIPFKRIGIVDSGWAGTTQDCIRATMDNAGIISGIYLGVSRQGQGPNCKSIKYGFLRDDFNLKPHHNPMNSTAGVIRVWETILREPHPTVTSLHQAADNKIKPLLKETDLLTNFERNAAISIQRGVTEGTLVRLKSTALIIAMSEYLCDSDIEKAAEHFSEKFSTRPSKEVANAVLHLGFDEGTARNYKRTQLGGLNDIWDGVAWYPGMLANAGFSWVSPLIEKTAKMALVKKLKADMKNHR